MTRAPRLYGFHATLKAPFRLRAEANVVDLASTVRRLAHHLRPIEIPGFTVSPLADFLALRPRSTIPDLGDLARACVSAVDDFRAPLSPEERQSRNPDTLTEMQRGNLDRWGYPYVFDEFRFHMTISGPLAAPSRQRLQRDVERLAHDVLMRGHPVGDLALVGQVARGAPFVVEERFPLGAWPDAGPDRVTNRSCSRSFG